MCSVAPDRNAAYGMPQAFTWNIGTMASARSASVMPQRRGHDRHRVQVGGPVRVHHALRVPGGAAGVAHQRRGPLVQLRPVVPGVLRAASRSAYRSTGTGRRAPTASPGPLTMNASTVGSWSAILRQQRDQGVVHDDDPVPGVVDDLGHLGAGQPDVQRVQHRAHRGHPEVGLQVLLVVPAERGHRVARPDPQPGQGPGQPPRVLRHGRVRGPAGARSGPGHALAAAVHAGAVPHDRADGEREVLHGAADHLVSSSCELHPIQTYVTAARRAHARSAPPGPGCSLSPHSTSAGTPSWRAASLTAGRSMPRAWASPSSRV